MSSFDKDLLAVVDVVRDKMEEAVAELGCVNALVAGGTGVGKSTLVNATFGSDIARTGHGRPVSSGVTWYTKPGLPYSLIDTRGLEMADFAATQKAIIDEVVRASKEPDPFKQVHVAWICVVESRRRVETAETELAEALEKLGVPVIAVITQARQDKASVDGEEKSFQEEVRRLVPCARAVVRVRALETQDDEGGISRQMGLDRLVAATNDVLPDGTRNAFAAAQRVDIELKASRAALYVHGAAVAAAGIGFTPIPFSDAALLVPVQVAMLAKISVAFGLATDQAFLRTLVGSAFSAIGGTLAGRAVVAALLKLVPGAGWIAGGAISGATAAAATEALGHAYIAVLKKLMTDGGKAQPTADAIGHALEIYLKSKAVKPDLPTDG